MAAGETSEASRLRSEADYEIYSMVRGHHVYKTVWTPVIEEQLYLEQEYSNPYDDFAVAVIKDHQIVGHIPENFAMITWHFISHGGSVYCRITGRRKKGKGLEVPCKYIYCGPSKHVKKLKKLLAEADTDKD